MKKVIMGLAMAIAAVAPASAFDLKDILGTGAGLGDAVGNLIEGVFTTSKLEVKDLAGEWKIEGSAVSFQSENFLMKAGGLAGAGAIESKLNPYYKKYGLIGGVFDINEDGTFDLTLKKMTLHGVITKLEDGNFEFTFQALGTFNIGSMKTYVEKSPSSLNLMFDASKLKQLLSIAATITGNQLAKAGSDILTQYDGICVGFKMTSVKPKSSVDDGSQLLPSAGELLNGIFNRKKK